MNAYVTKALGRIVPHFMGWGGMASLLLYLLYAKGVAHSVAWLVLLLGVFVAVTDESIEHFALDEDPRECLLDIAAKSAGLTLAAATSAWWWR